MPPLSDMRIFRPGMSADLAEVGEPEALQLQIFLLWALALASPQAPWLPSQAVEAETAEQMVSCCIFLWEDIALQN